MAVSTVVILAAGRGTRMRSATPKLAHDLCGRPLLAWPIAAARAAGAGAHGRRRRPRRAADRRARRRRRGGRAGAAARHRRRGRARACRQIDRDAVVVVLAGDVPLIEAAMLRELVIAHERAGAAATIVTTVLDDPRGYGRVVRDGAGEIERIVETKVAGRRDATAELAIREVNTVDLRLRRRRAARRAAAQVGAANEQGERYLTDVVALLRARRRARSRRSRSAIPPVVMGVNDRVQLAAVRAEAQRRIQERHMLAGVTIVQPSSTSIDVGVTIGADTVIEPCTQLLGATSVGARRDGRPAHAPLIDARLGDGVSVVRSHLVRCELRDGATVGPFAYLRPDALLRERAKVGHVRRDQELRDRRRREGAAPLLRRRRRRRRADQPRRRHDHRQLRRRRQAPHDDRRARPRRRRTPRSSRRSRSATTPGRRPARSSPATCRPARSPSRARASATSSATPSGAARRSAAGRGPAPEQRLNCGRDERDRAAADHHQPSDRLRQAADAVQRAARRRSSPPTSPASSASSSGRRR